MTQLVNSLSVVKSKTHRLCDICSKKFKKFSSTQTTCGFECALELSERKLDKRKAKLVRAAKRQNKADRKAFRENDRPLQLKNAQKAVNWYVKYVQELGKPCYTCGKELKNGPGTHAGHWLTVGAHPEKRFDTRHMRKQCYSCNTHNGGEPVIFEKNLRLELGDELVDEIRNSKPPKLTTPEVVELRKKFQAINLKARKSMEAEDE